MEDVSVIRGRQSGWKNGFCTYIFPPDHLSAEYRTAENFQGRKLSQIGDFYEENFSGLLTRAAPKDTMSQNFAEKTFVNSYKTAKFMKVFSLKLCFTIIL